MAIHHHGESSIVPFFPSTKGFAAITHALANAHGWLDYGETVAVYRPEFAQKIIYCRLITEAIGTTSRHYMTARCNFFFLRFDDYSK
jgi:hypothetical protein